MKSYEQDQYRELRGGLIKASQCATNLIELLDSQTRNTREDHTDMIEHLESLKRELEYQSRYLFRYQ